MRREIAGLVLLITLLLCGCKERTWPPSEVSLGDMKIVVWDVKEPHLPGAPPYSELLSLVVENYANEHGAIVEVEFKSRQEIENLLLGNHQGEVPSVVFSTEWPFMGEGTQDLTAMIKAGDYLEDALSFWVYDGKLMGIPSYIHWLCLAKRAASDDSPGAAGYFLTAPGFLHSALDYGCMDWAEQDICDYVEWVKDTYGLYSEPVLDLWERNQISTLYPVTPHLFRWLRLSEKDCEIEMLPMDTPQGEARFYFSVPGYVILAGSQEEVECAVELAKLLAASKGRWAARAVGCIPAHVHDVPVFDLESGFTREERVNLVAGLRDSGACVVDWVEFGSRSNIRLAVTPAIERYLSGSTGRREFEESIRSALKGHTSQ
ncbi:MAG TPA: hypothetical protein GX529_01450 [Firmicutes bacterium]|nr:hypothetical protein [Candidatus Fermentithermobacillaceae bacterium]